MLTWDFFKISCSELEHACSTGKIPCQHAAPFPDGGGEGRDCEEGEERSLRAPKGAHALVMTLFISIVSFILFSKVCVPPVFAHITDASACMLRR
jgi:hypothetical protein